MCDFVDAELYLSVSHLEYAFFECFYVSKFEAITVFTIDAYLGLFLHESLDTRTAHTTRETELVNPVFS